MFLRTFGIDFNLTQYPFVSFTPPVWVVKEPVSIVTTAKIGEMYFGQYLVQFEIASVILLMALIGAIVLAMRDSDMDSTYEESHVGKYDSNEAQTFPVISTKK